MRLWTLHPRYLDPRGLVALWREGLLARAVLGGRTVGYRRHPQLVRFSSHAAPRDAIDTYLAVVLEEAASRRYSFDATKLDEGRTTVRIAVTDGQLVHEWRHLLAKLSARCPPLYEQWRMLGQPEPHPLFHIVRGPIEPWERTGEGEHNLH